MLWKLAKLFAHFTALSAESLNGTSSTAGLPPDLIANKRFGGVLKSMLTLNEAIIDVKEG